MEGVISMSRKKQNGVVLPVVVDTFGGVSYDPGKIGRGEVSYMELKTYRSFRANKTPHLLSPIHIDKIRKLPF